jgi:hypothetical protein
VRAALAERAAVLTVYVAMDCKDKTAIRRLEKLRFSYNRKE